MEKQLLKNTNGIDIFVNSDGKFSAKIAGKEVSKRNLRDLEKQIEQMLEPVELYEISSSYSGGPHNPVKRKIIKFEDDRARHSDGSIDSKYGSGDYYSMTAEELQKAKEFVAQNDKLKREWSDFTHKLLRVSEKNFEEIRSQRKEAKPANEEL